MTPGTLVDDRLSTIALAPIAGDLAAAPFARQAVRRGFPRRWYQRIALAPTREAWLIGCGEGHELELRDHGDSSGAIAVVTGCLVEQAVDAAGTAGTGGSWAAGASTSSTPATSTTWPTSTPSPR